MSYNEYIGQIRPCEFCHQTNYIKINSIFENQKCIRYFYDTCKDKDVLLKLDVYTDQYVHGYVIDDDYDKMELYGLIHNEPVNECLTSGVIVKTMNGKLHNPNGPAIVVCHQGQAEREIYALYGFVYLARFVWNDYYSILEHASFLNPNNNYYLPEVDDEFKELCKRYSNLKAFL